MSQFGTLQQVADFYVGLRQRVSDEKPAVGLAQALSRVVPYCLEEWDVQMFAIAECRNANCHSPAARDALARRRVQVTCNCMPPDEQSEVFGFEQPSKACRDLSQSKIRRDETAADIAVAPIPGTMKLPN